MKREWACCRKVILNAACVGILEVTALTRSETIKTGVTVDTQLQASCPRIQCEFRVWVSSSPTIILAGPTVLSAVGVSPPHDGVR